MDNRELSIILKLKDQASKQMDGFKSTLESMQPQFKQMAAIGPAAFAGIAGAVGLSVKAYIESEKQLAVMDGLIANFSSKTLAQFNGSVDKTRQAITEWSAEMQNLGGIADEELSIGISKLLQVTQDWTLAQQAATLATDFATYADIDFSTSVKLITGVLNGNYGALTRYGIAIDDTATKEEALAALTARVGGLYEKSGKTLAGQLKILKESFGDLQEEIGRVFVPILTKLISYVRPIIQNIIEWTKNNPGLIKTLVAIGLAVSALIAGIGLLGLALPAIITGFGLLFSWVTVIVGAIAAVIAIFILFRDRLMEIFTLIIQSSAFQYLQEIAKNLWKSIQDLWVSFSELWKLIDEPVLEILKYLAYFIAGVLIVAIIGMIEILNSLVKGIMYFVDSTNVSLKALREFIRMVVDAWINAKNNLIQLWNDIKSAFKSAVYWIYDNAIQPLMGWINNLLNALQRVKDTIASISSKVTGAVGSVLGGTINTVKSIIGVQDAVISPDGRVITTDPKDYLIATKDPASLAGRGVINITITGNTFMSDEDMATKVGDKIISVLKMQYAI